MKVFQTLVGSILALATAASAISVIVPLYLYPDPGAWDPLYYAIGNYTSITFYVVVNVDSGPGCSGCSYPTDSNFVDGISKLNKYKNVYTLGYVSTFYTQRPYSTVLADVDTYAKWGYYTTKNVSMAGIFFDEMNSTTAAASYTYYRNVTKYAYNNVPSTVTPIVLNPGVPAPSTYFNYADFIVEYEQTYGNYSNPKTLSTFTSYKNSQAAVIIQNTPVGANYTSLVHPMVTSGIGCVFITTDYYYKTLGSLKDLTAAVAKG